jgi:hypothetical protein
MIKFIFSLKCFGLAFWAAYLTTYFIDIKFINIILIATFTSLICCMCYEHLLMLRTALKNLEMFIKKIIRAFYNLFWYFIALPILKCFIGGYTLPASTWNKCNKKIDIDFMKEW